MAPITDINYFPLYCAIYMGPDLLHQTMGENVLYRNKIYILGHEPFCTTSHLKQMINSDLKYVKQKTRICIGWILIETNFIRQSLFRTTIPHFIEIHQVILGVTWERTCRHDLTTMHSWRRIDKNKSKRGTQHSRNIIFSSPTKLIEVICSREQ
jgi:hypothetical protein